MQSYKTYEVIISDDSPDDEVKALVAGYAQQLPNINYWKNSPAKGMPENWNTAISQAKGEWIKIMHDDDWFLTPDALSEFAARTATNADFICSNYENNFMDAGDKIVKRLAVLFPKHKLNVIAKEPLLLLADNIIGPPSVCMVRAEPMGQYDKRLRWRVDIDYYKTILTRCPKIELIENILIGVGMNANQITNQTKNIPEVELPEAYILLQKYGTDPLRNWIIYDSWWRMFRNMQITSYKQLQQYVPELWPPVIIKLLNFRERTPDFLLKTGITSKLCMFLSRAGNKNITK